MDVNRLHHLKTVFRAYKLALTTDLERLIKSLRNYAYRTNDLHGDKVRELEAAHALLSQLEIASEAELLSLIAAVGQPPFDVPIPHYDE